MNTMDAFAMGKANHGKSLMVFDWNKAARIINELGALSASAGLSRDWEYTGGEIFTDGKPNTESFTYLASTWATPKLSVNGYILDCFLMEEDVPKEWGNDFNSIKWPESALKELD